MVFVWNPLAIVPTICLIVGAVLAWLIYAAAPTRPTNRRLAIVIAVEGVTWATGAGLLYVMDHREAAWAMQGVFVTGVLGLPWLYLLFLSTLETPLVAFLRPRFVQWMLVATLVGIEAYWLTHTSTFMPDIVAFPDVWYAAYEVVLGPAMERAFQFMGLISLFALVTTISTFRRAKTDIARRRAKAYAWAFGARDVGFLMVFGIWTFFLPLPPEGGGWTDVMFIQTVPTTMLVFIVLLAYGVLRAHILDIDIRIKWTLQRGTIAGIFLAVFVIVEQLIQSFVGTAGLGIVVGAVAAGLLLFALTPLQNFAHRLADAAMPRAKAVASMSEAERSSLFSDLARDAWSDGSLTRKERQLLDNAATRLGLSMADAGSLERRAAATLRA